jgi:hypothetical protein
MKGNCPAGIKELIFRSQAGRAVRSVCKENGYWLCKNKHEPIGFTTKP